MHASTGLSGESLDYLTSYDSSDKTHRLSNTQHKRTGGGRRSGHLRMYQSRSRSLR